MVLGRRRGEWLELVGEPGFLRLRGHLGEVLVEELADAVLDAASRLASCCGAGAPLIAAEAAVHVE